MPIPILYTERLLLKPLASEDASQIQLLFPRWEIVRYMVSSVPWPYPDNGAESYVNNVALPDMANGIAWFWTIRNLETPDKLMGVICLYDVEDNNRGFWLAPEHQGQGFMREASNAATDYWFNSLNKTVLRAPKAALNSRSKIISESSGMRLIRTEKKDYVSGLLDSELWEITREEWNARQGSRALLSAVS
ncbi:GNAT family N-acetyltransferase [Enterobacter sp.]|uniref:GNAT family N-acetyltransferase n=1 Tax=Enterobacter sp. TaxID=42895 RepID=UPI00296FA59E|nr:GNAT family N-acetyltransferase [Enterobacter sp.]